MTYEELLARISKLSITPETNVVPSELATALMAVMELHKPIHNPNFPDSDKWCWQCAEGRGYAKYPCPTIQAIEKELK